MTHNMPQRAAVLAIGSNSTRLLVANLDTSLSQPVRGREPTRLYLALGQDGQLQPQARENLIAALLRLKHQAEAAGAASIHLLATAALRDSSSTAELALAIKEETGLTLQLISGQEEARYSLLGATCPYGPDSHLGVMDIGGGSTELALRQGGDMGLALSLPLGASRLHSLCPVDSLEKLQEAEVLVDEVLDRTLPIPLPSAPEGWLLVGGTGTALISLLAGSLDLDWQQDLPFTRLQAEQALSRLAACSLSQRAAQPGMTPGREAILPTGLVILCRLMHRLGIDMMRVTQRNNCDGFLSAQVYSQSK